jgi:hypothetical protein
MRAAAYIVTEPVLNTRFRYRFILTDSIGRMAGLYSLRTDEVAAFMVYRDATSAIGHMRSGSPRERPTIRRSPSSTRPAATSEGWVIGPITAPLTFCAHKAVVGGFGGDLVEGRPVVIARRMKRALDGAGLCSAELFLIHQLRRQDILNAGDIGVRRAIAHARTRNDAATIDEVRQRGQGWAPGRSYATALFCLSLTTTEGTPA